MNEDENSGSSSSNFSSVESSVSNVDLTSTGEFQYTQFTDSTQDPTLGPFSNHPSRERIPYRRLGG